jgi:hypothetical protein
MLNNVATQWIIRRIPEFSGIIITLITFYNSMPPEHRQFVTDVLSGQGGGLTIGAAIGFALWVYAQVVSYRSTVKPKEVAKVDGKAIEVTAPRKSLSDILKGK